MDNVFYIVDNLRQDELAYNPSIGNSVSMLCLALYVVAALCMDRWSPSKFSGRGTRVSLEVLVHGIIRDPFWRLLIEV